MAMLSDELPNLPLILAGPILRQTTPTTVTVWVALQKERRVTLRVYGTGADNTNTVCMIGTDNTTQLGDNLHLIALTAYLTDSAPPELRRGEIYHYDLFFGEDLGVDVVEDDPTIALLGTKILMGDTYSVEIHYPNTGHPLPSFVLPPESLDKLRLIHGSCRKPHGEKRDMFPYLDELIDGAATDALKRPHQLFLTGDQIYADDVHPALLHRIMDANSALFNWVEKLPGVEESDERLKPGKRQPLAKDVAKFTSTAADSHLFKLGEYCAMYLFVWSDVLWLSAADADLQEFYSQLPAVRRALANIPSYMICDDHEITDDWNLTLQWCNNVLGSALGHRVLFNGLIAFALFQAWGNTPEQFGNGTPGGKLLDQIVNWRPTAANSSLGTPANDVQVAIGTELSKILCLPGYVANDAAIRKLREDRGFHNLHDLNTLDFHFAVEGPQYQVLVLDTRTWRAYPSWFDLSDGEIAGDDSNLRFGSNSAALLNETGFKAQIRARRPATAKELTFVVSPGPVISLEYVLGARRKAQYFSFGVEKTVDYEDWETIRKVVNHFMESLIDFGVSQTDDGDKHWQTKIAFLSGDIHFGYTTRIRYTHQFGVFGTGDSADVIFAQLNASAFHNEADLTRRVQSTGSQLFDFGTPEAVDDGDYYFGPYREMRWRLRHIVANPKFVPAPQPKAKPAAGNPKAAFKQTQEVAKLQKPDPDLLEEVDQVVGINNFGDVTFAGTGSNRGLIHTLHWLGGNSPYRVSLAFEQF